MRCTSPAVTVEEYEEISTATTTGAAEQKPVYRRRHSSFHPRRKSSSGDAMDGDEGLLLRVGLPQFKSKEQVTDCFTRSISFSPNSKDG